MSFSRLCIVFLLCGLMTVFLSTPQKIFAARSLTISSTQSVLHGYDEMTITISSQSGFTNGETIYIKGALYKDGSTNYFGFTKNGDAWIKNGDSVSSQRQIQIGSWDNQLVIKSDFDDSGYLGEGDYKVKVGFYYSTSGGNPSSINWSTNSLDVTINEPDPTPTPTSSPPTNTPVPTAKPTATPTPKPTITKIPTFAIASVSAGSSDAAILGSSISAEPTLIKGIADAKKNSPNFLAIFLIIGGILILSSCGILFYYQRRKQQTHEATNE